MTERQIKKNILKILRHHFSSWNQVNKEDFKFSRCTGLTNITYVVKTNNSEAFPKEIIYREFCKNEILHQFFTREDENKIFN